MTRVDGRRLMGIGLAQARPRTSHLSLRHCRKLGTPHMLGRELRQQREHLEADVLALTVAIEPKAEPAAALCLLPKVLHDAEPLGRLLDHLVRLCLVRGRVPAGSG